MIYYGSKISDNLSTSPEGFLICHNVPIARTGYQDYLGSEFPQEMQAEYRIDPNKVYKVYRSAEEVFSPATVASFEGKPFTDNHPSELVTTQNISMYGKGHIQNVRQGAGEYANMLLADIICTDEAVANAITEKLKREVSCGYNMVFTKGKKGFEQTQIRGNHLALVENGRAGQKAAIQDSIPDAIKQKKKGEPKIMKNNIFYKMFAAFAKDADPEELEEAGQALSAIGGDAEPETPPAPTGGNEDLKKEVAELKTSMAEIVSTLKELVKSDKDVHENLTDEEKLENLEKETKDDLTSPDEEVEGKEHEAPGNLIEADEDPEEKKIPQAMDAAVKSLIKTMKPKLLAIKDEKARSQAVDAFVSAVNDARAVKEDPKNNYAALQRAVASHTTKDAKAKTMDQRRSEQVSTINKYNPHLKKEEK